MPTVERTPFIDGDWDFWALYDAGQWEPETKATLERFLKPGDLFIDIGAWIGPVSLWALDLGADVVAYEPDPVAYAQLVRNAPQVDAHKAALGATTHVGYLENPSGFGNSMSRLAADGERVVVLSTWLASRDWPRTPALIKLDVEGSEIDILPTLAPWCLKHRTPLLVSWHQDWWPRPATERSTWFHGFTSVEGKWHGFNTLLAIP
jgi:FkbM family methyltransferase